MFKEKDKVKLITPGWKNWFDIAYVIKAWKDKNGNEKYTINNKEDGTGDEIKIVNAKELVKL